MKRKKWFKIGIGFVCIMLVCGAIFYMNPFSVNLIKNESSKTIESVDIPEYSGTPYVEINDDEPFFTEEEKDVSDSYESYSDLDSLGRCQVAMANIGTDIMPEEERESIGQIKPTGWHTVRYDDLIEDHYLYNRCHLIAFELAGENDNEKNLITGTRYLNIYGMLPFENEVAFYVKETGNHVLYRVTPIFEGDNLVASGVEIEGWSVEDNGADICFNVYCYNVQPGIEIDYATGDSKVQDTQEETEEVIEQADENEQTYILNTSRKKIHLPTCSSVNDMAEHNKKEVTSTIEELEEQGYTPCQRCLPNEE